MNEAERTRTLSDPGDGPSWVDAIENPYLRGPYTPFPRETTAEDLPVAGELPRDLYGAFVRNGPNPVYEPVNLYHWFDGDGMIHAVYFRDGRVDYRSRWIRTAGALREAREGRAIWPGMLGPLDFELEAGPLKDTANTDVVHFRKRLIALWYVAGTPYCLDPLTLEALGVEDFGGGRHTTVSAHPKVDSRTGELLWFTYGDDPPYMHYGVVSKHGKLVHEIPVELPGPRLPHDLTITERFSILHDLPLFHDPDELRRTKRRILHFHRDVPTRFGVVPRYGASHEVRWFEFEPCYVLHMVNAWEEGDWIVMDGCRQRGPVIRRRPEEGRLASMLGYFRSRAHLHRWAMNVRTGEVREEPLDDLNVEFPLPDTQRYGTKTRYSYHQHLAEDAYTLDFKALVKYDHADGSSTRFEYGPTHMGGEAPFAPREGATGEDDGYVVTIVSDMKSHSSECWVLHAQDLERGPIARVELPARVPIGFHAKWIPGVELWPVV